ncbi:hypothetical protein AKJ09_03665 [Labilithrix luteola]|uniref:Uncharacterized protein n=1 Tax=Labilithrix luteola TaxID=1391654 RepID=A0A0K1PUF3_9BACT|nr:hypothetical protein [Labilithrix luteola]AKU97001.1 hypothetical protein AKJ09_03665 [Labilithrix luteola]
MLQFQIQQSPFRLGLAEGVDPRLAPFGTLTQAVNAVWKKSGRLEKRNGTTKLTNAIMGGGTITTANRLGVRGSELMLFDVDGNAFTYTNDTLGWRRIPGTPRPGLTWRTELDSNSGVAGYDCVVAGNALVTAWISGSPYSSGGPPTGPLWLRATDLTSGKVLFGPTQLAASANGVRIVKQSETVVAVIFSSGPNINMQGFIVSSMTLDPGLPVATLRADNAGTSFDACLLSNGTICIAYNSAIRLELYAYNYVPGVSITQAAAGGVTGTGGTVSICSTSTELYVSWFASVGFIRTAIASPITLAQVVAATNVEAAISAPLSISSIAKAGRCLLAYSLDFGAPTRMLVTINVSSSGVVDTGSRRATGNVQSISRPFTLNGADYIYVADNFRLFGGGSYLLQIPSSNGGTGTLIPHLYIGRIDTLLGANVMLGTVTPMPDGKRSVGALPYLSEVSGPATTTRLCALRTVVMAIRDMRPVDHDRSVQYGREMYCSGAVLSAYDGRLLFDYGWSREPEIVNVAQNGTGSMGAGLYQYAGVLAYRSSAGVVHRSAPSAMLAPYTAAANSRAQVDLRTVCTQSKATAENGDIASVAPTTSAILVYRTTAGQPQLYELTILPNVNALTFDPKQTTNSLLDDKADASIGGGTNVALATRPTIYTQGGVLPDEQPPAFVTMTLHKSRLWGIDGSQRKVWFSKSFEDDFGFAPGFSSSFVMDFESDVTALASLDDKLVVMGGNWIRYILGDGPGPNGADGIFQPPQPIQTNTGCISPRSVVSTPLGIMFQSARGIELLSRTLEVAWLGKSVRDTLAAFPVVTSAVLVPNTNHVRFSCNTTDGTAGCVLVFDLSESQWTTFVYSDGLATSLPIADACLLNGSYTFVTSGGVVYTETTAHCLDAGATYVPMRLETAEYSATGPLAFQSVRAFSLEGISNDNHDLQISVWYNGDTVTPDTVTFAAGSPVTTPGPLEGCDVSPGTRRKCQFIRFTIQDSAPSGGLPVGTGKGPSFDSMGIEVGVKRGFGKKPATKTG